MSISVTEDRVGQVLVLSPEGRLDSVNTGEFQSLTMGHIDGGEKNMIMDFSSLNYISSAGIRVTRLASNALEESGGQFVICAMNEYISKVYRISGFDRIIAVADTREEALARFSPSS